MNFPNCPLCFKRRIALSQSPVLELDLIYLLQWILPKGIGSWFFMRIVELLINTTIKKLPQMVVPKWVLILDEPWGKASLQEGNCDSQKSLCWSVGTGLSMQYVKHRVRERERGVETWKKTKCEEVCVEENRDKGEVKKTKGEENVAENKMRKKKGVVLVIRVVWGQGHEQIFFFYLK